MLKSKNGAITIKGKPGTIREELNDLLRALYWKNIVDAEDMVFILTKSILEAKDLDKEEEEEEEEDEEE